MNQIIMKRRDAETERDAFNARGSGPTHDKLLGFYDYYLRRRPDLDPEMAFALAWGGLTPAEHRQIRAEESGEYQAQEAEEARRRASAIRADRRGKTMKTEVGILLKAIAGVYDDDELSRGERADVLADVLDDYLARTGRDGLADIAGVPVAKTAAQVLPEDLTKAETHQALALTVLEGKAAQIRKQQPALSREQSMARAIRENPDIFAMERAASRARFEEQATVMKHSSSVQQDLAIAKRDDAWNEIRKVGAELRKSHPELSQQQANARAMALRPDLARAEREASRGALYAV